MQFWVTANFRERLQKKESRKETGQMANQERSPKFPKGSGPQPQPLSAPALHDTSACVLAAVTGKRLHKRKMSEGTNRWEEILLGGKHMGKCLLLLKEQRHRKSEKLNGHFLPIIVAKIEGRWKKLQYVRLGYWLLRLWINTIPLKSNLAVCIRF